MIDSCSPAPPHSPAPAHSPAPPHAPAPALLDARLLALIPEARLAAQPLPLVPELHLWLLTPDYPRGRLPDEVALAIMERPAYWAFCWASGQVLARWLLDHPETVAGRTVLDFGAGSGVVAVAAARAGAARVIACDDDADALAACAANAELNGVALELCDDLAAAPRCELALVADVLYDRDNLPLLEALCAGHDTVLLADSRVKPDVIPDWQVFETVAATTVPDLDEAAEFGTVRLYAPAATATGD